MLSEIKNFTIKDTFFGLNMHQAKYAGDRVLVFSIPGSKHILCAFSTTTISKIDSFLGVERFDVSKVKSNGRQYVIIDDRQDTLFEIMENLYNVGVHFIIGGEYANYIKDTLSKKHGLNDITSSIRFASLAAMAVCEAIFESYDDNYEELLTLLTVLSKRVYDFIKSETDAYLGEQYKYFSTNSNIVIRVKTGEEYKQDIDSNSILINHDKYLVFLSDSEDLGENDIVIDAFDSLEPLVARSLQLGLSEEELSDILSKTSNSFVDKYYMASISREDFKKYLFDREINADKYFYKYFGLLGENVPIGLVKVSEIVYIIDFLRSLYPKKLQDENHILIKTKNEILQALESKLEFEVVDKANFRGAMTGHQKALGTRKYITKDIFVFRRIIDFLLQLFTEEKNVLWDAFYNFSNKARQDIAKLKKDLNVSGQDITNYTQDVKNFADYVHKFILYYRDVLKNETNPYELLYKDFLDMLNYATSGYKKTGKFYLSVDENLYNDVNVFLASTFSIFVGKDEAHPRFIFDDVLSNLAKTYNVSIPLDSISYEHKFALLLAFIPELYLLLFLYGFLSFAKNSVVEDIALQKKIRHVSYSKRTLKKLGVSLSEADALMIDLINVIKEHDLNGTSFVLAVFLYLNSYFRDSTWRRVMGSSGEDVFIRINDLFNVAVSKSLLVSLKNEFYTYFIEYVKNITQVLELDSWFIQNNPVYAAIASYYNYLHSSKTLTSNLYSFQEEGINRILLAYQDLDKTGHLLVSPPGSGKSFIIAKSIERIYELEKQAGKNIKVLYLAMNNSVNNFLENAIYFFDSYRSIFAIRSREDFEKVLKEHDKLPFDFYALSYSLLVSFVTGRRSIARTYPSLKEENIEDFAKTEEDELRSSEREASRELRNKKHGVQEYQRIASFLDLFDVVVLDDAVAIKNLYVQYLDRGKSYKSDGMVTDALSIALEREYKYKIYQEANTSVLASLLFYYYLYYINNKENKKLKRKFFLVSTSVLVSNWPEDAWFPMYLTGVSKDNDFFVAEVGTFLTPDPIRFAKYWFMRNTVYLDTARELVTFVKASDYQNDVFSYDKLLDHFIEGVSQKEQNDVYPLKVRINEFRKYLDKMKQKNYLTVYTDADLYREGLILRPEKKSYLLDVEEDFEKILSNTKKEDDILFFKNTRSYLNNNISSLSDTITRYLQVVIQESPDVLDSVLQEGVLENPLVWIKQDLVEDMKEIINTVGYYWHGSLFERMSDFNEEFFRGFVKVLRGEEYSYSGPLIAVPTYKYKYKKFYVPKSNYLDRANISKSILSFASNLQAVFDQMESGLVDLKLGSALLKMPFVIKYILYDALLHWIRVDAKDIRGNGKIVANTSYRHEGWLLYLAFAELLYNIYSSWNSEKGVNIKELLEKIHYKTTVRTLALRQLISQSTRFLNEERQLDFMFKLYSEFVYLLSSSIETIESDLYFKGQKQQISKDHAKAVLLNLFRVMFLERLITFYRSLLTISAGNTTKLESELYGFEVNKLNKEYGVDVHKTVYKKMRYLDLWENTLTTQNYLDMLSRIVANVSDKELLDSEDSLAYLKAKRIISEMDEVRLRNKAYQIVSRAFSNIENEEGIQRRLFATLDDKRQEMQKIRLADVGRFKLSDYFRRSNELILVITTGYRKLASLDISDADILYFVNVSSTCAHMYEIEGRVARINSDKPVKVRYFLTNTPGEQDVVCRLAAKELVVSAFFDIGKNIISDLMQYEFLTPDEFAERISDKIFAEKIKNMQNTQGQKLDVKVEETKDIIRVKSNVPGNVLIDAIKKIKK